MKPTYEQLVAWLESARVDCILKAEAIRFLEGDVARAILKKEEARKALGDARAKLDRAQTDYETALAIAKRDGILP